ncbi:hypothetical protein GTV15_03960 [Streptomyces sp. SID7803]|nr:hypothetical protein [Streptomyces sp. SID7803]
MIEGLSAPPGGLDRDGWFRKRHIRSEPPQQVDSPPRTRPAWTDASNLVKCPP